MINQELLDQIKEYFGPIVIVPEPIDEQIRLFQQQLTEFQQQLAELEAGSQHANVALQIFKQCGIEAIDALRDSLNGLDWYALLCEYPYYSFWDAHCDWEKLNQIYNHLDISRYRHYDLCYFETLKLYYRSDTFDSYAWCVFWCCLQKYYNNERIAKLFCPLLCRPGAFAASKCF